MNAEDLVAEQLGDDDPVDVLSLVEAVFPGSRLTRRRTYEEHAAFWGRLTSHVDAQRRAETLAAATLRQFRRRHDTP